MKPRRLPTRGWVAALALLLLACAFGASCSEADKPVEPDEQQPEPLAIPKGDTDAYGVLPETVGGFKVTRGAAAGYVPDKACNECHAEIYESYQQMGMARSFYPPTKDNVIEELGKTYHHKLTDRYYMMERRDGKLYQKRWCLDKQGKRFAEYEAEVAWIIGSGNHVRTYLSHSDHGERFELPLSWYPGVGWRMSPGYHIKNHWGFGTNFVPSPDSLYQWRRAFKRAGPHDVTTYVTMGDTLANTDAKPAVEVLTEAVEKFPNSAQAHASLGNALLHVRRIQDAVRHLDKASAISPKDPEIAMTQGTAYDMLGDLPKARAAYERSIASRPTNRDVWRQLGSILIRMNEKEAALEALMKAIALGPDEEWCYQNAASLHEEAGRWAESFEILEQGATRLLNVRLRLVVSYCLAPKERANPAKARMHANEAARDNPKDERCRLYEVFAAIHTNDLMAARLMLESAQKTQADPACVAGLGAIVTLKNPDTKGADSLLEDFERELKTPGGDRQLRFIVGTILEKMRK